MLQVQNISFSYDGKKVIKQMTFSLNKGQNIAVIGESGSGKSTLLKLIYGLYDLDEGQIFWDGIEVLGSKFNLVPGMPFMKYLSQDFDLMPYISVSENVGKYLSNTNIQNKQRRILELLDIVEMTDFTIVKANLLSGGQKQRVAIARVLALEPEILLLDEPFSQIDNFRKNSLRRNLFAYLKLKGITCIVATHDSADSLSFADETIVLQNGELITKSKSLEIYQNPLNRYVASLFGEVNELKKSKFSKIESDNEILLLYPHQLKITEGEAFRVLVKQSYFKGSHYLIKAVANGSVVFFNHHSELEVNVEVSLEL